MSANHPDNANLPVVNRPETIKGVTITFLIIACAAISLRLYVRLKERLWGWDDLFVALAGVATIVGSTITCLMPDNGMGRHFWTLDEHERIEYFKHIWSTNTTYCASTTFIKLSLLMQYLRLFSNHRTMARPITITLAVVSGVWGLTFFLLALFACHPIEKNWNYSVPGECIAWGSKNAGQFFASWVTHASTNMLLDLLVFLLPIPFLRSLRMGGKTKMGLIALFTMGGIVVTLSIARLISLCIKRAGTVPVFDVTYATPAIYLFSVLEINIAILCASIPIFWPLVSSLAGNKILVVNEIEVRTDRRNSQSIALADQGADKGVGGSFAGAREDTEGRTSRISVLANKIDGKTGLGLSMTRSTSPSRSKHRHSHKPSSTSITTLSRSGKNMLNALSHTESRTSRESQRNLAHQGSIGSLSMSGSPQDGSGPLEQVRSSGSISHYQDRYVQDLVVPDFDKSSSGNAAHTTTVERAEIPFDHIRAWEK